MLLELLLAIIIGCLLGLVSGLTPGLHINLLAAIIFSALPFLSTQFSVLAVAAAIISMSITHTFTDFIPTIFLGAASEDTALAAYPGNELLLLGLGFDALKLTTVGGLLGLILFSALAPLLLLAVPFIFKILSGYVGVILLCFSALLILWQRTASERLWSSAVFLMSGLLGLVVLGINGLNEPLLPMLSGLFGASLLFVNLGRGISMPKQHIAEVIELKWKELLKPVSLSVFSGSLVSIFPALGPAQSAAIATRLFGKGSSYAYLVLLGGINTVSMLMGIITMYTIGKARNGSIDVVHGMLQNVSASQVFMLLAVSMVSGCIAVFMTLIAARLFAAFVSRINYRLLCLAVICAVTFMVAAFSGFVGIIVLLTATAIGLLPIIKNVGRSNAMGCLIVPVILYYIM